MPKENEQSRHVGGKPGAKDEAANRKATKKKTTDQKDEAKPKNADVGSVKKDR